MAWKCNTNYLGYEWWLLQSPNSKYLVIKNRKLKKEKKKRHGQVSLLEHRGSDAAPWWCNEGTAKKKKSKKNKQKQISLFETLTKIR